MAASFGVECRTKRCRSKGWSGYTEKKTNRLGLLVCFGNLLKIVYIYTSNAGCDKIWYKSCSAS